MKLCLLTKCNNVLPKNEKFDNVFVLRRFNEAYRAKAKCCTCVFVDL